MVIAWVVESNFYRDKIAECDVMRYTTENLQIRFASQELLRTMQSRNDLTKQSGSLPPKIRTTPSKNKQCGIRWMCARSFVHGHLRNERCRYCRTYHVEHVPHWDVQAKFVHRILHDGTIWRRHVPCLWRPLEPNPKKLRNKRRGLAASWHSSASTCLWFR